MGNAGGLLASFLCGGGRFRAGKPLYELPHLVAIFVGHFHKLDAHAAAGMRTANHAITAQVSYFHQQFQAHPGSDLKRLRELHVTAALVRVQDSQLPLWGQVTDISQGGCYVQLAQPLKIGTRVSLELLMKIANLRGDGVICSSHAGRGMGIKFVEMSNEYRDQVRQFVKWFAGAEPATTAEETGKQPAGVTHSPAKS